MAKGKKSGGRDFEPGNKLGKGQPPLPPDLREVRKLGRSQVEAKLWDLISKTKRELGALISDDAPMIDRIIANVLLQAAENGDEKRLNWFLDRTIGKVTQPISFENELKKTPNEVLVEQGKKALEIVQLHAGGANGNATVQGRKAPAN